MVFIKLFFVILFINNATFGNILGDYKPPNQVMSAELVCTDHDMQLHVLLEKPLTHSARIFVKEQSADPHCVHRYEANSDHNALMFRVPLSTCGMQKIQYHSTKFSFTTSIVVSFHRFFVSSYDRSFRITCDYAKLQQPPKQEVTVGVGVKTDTHNTIDDKYQQKHKILTGASPTNYAESGTNGSYSIPTKFLDYRESEESDVNEVYPETADCSYKLFHRKNSTTMEKAKTVHLGAELEHFWGCQNLRASQFIFVHDCTVNPEFSLGNDPILIDSNGCPVDETGIGEIHYSADGKTATSKHLAYKFADYPNLLFKCSITVCQDFHCKFSDGTPISLPLNCAQKRSIRSPNFSQNNSIELSEIVNVEDAMAQKPLDREDPHSETFITSFCPSFLAEVSILLLSAIFMLFSALLFWKSRKN